MAHYLINFVKGDAANGPALREQAAGFLRAMMWGIDADEIRGGEASGVYRLVSDAA